MSTEKAKEVSFKKVQPGSTEALASTAVAVSQSTAVERAPATYGDDSEHLDAGDISMPRINVVQKVGELSNVFNEGEVILNKELSILDFDKKTGKSKGTLNIIFVGFRPDRYSEKLDGGKLGRLVATEEEVVAAGGTTSYDVNKANKAIPLFQRLAEPIILIEKPEGIQDDSAFIYEANGKQYAAILWSLKGSSFTSVVKNVRTARKVGWLADSHAKGIKKAYFFGQFKLHVELRTFGDNFALVPVVTKDCETTPELRELAQTFLGQ